MKREFLEGLGLEKEVVDKIMAENGNDINAEKAKIASKDEEIKTLSEQIKDANKTIKSYKEMNIEDIKKSAEDWEETANKYKTDLESLRQETALKEGVRAYNSVDEDVLLKLIDRDSLKFTDDGINGLKEQIEGLKESKPYLFKADDSNNQNDNRFNAHTPPENDGGEANPMAAEIASIFNDN